MGLFSVSAKDTMYRLRELIQNKETENAHRMLDEIDPVSLNYIFEENETILHVATKYDNGSLVRKILLACPQLVKVAKIGTEYKGQTALHIVITKANRSAMKFLLDAAERLGEETLSDLLKTCATGTQFEGTVMMGQLPLFVAALKFDTKMVEKLIFRGADIFAKNKSGDTIFHSLLHYLNRKRDKDLEVKQMLEVLHKKINAMTEKAKAEKEEEELEEYWSSKERRLNEEYFEEEQVDSKESRPFPFYTHLWLVKNKEKLTPLKLAARYKLVEIFEYILELKDVYCFHNEDEGLFDIKKYDVTEIDSVANYEDETKSKISGRCGPGSNYNESVLQMMFDKDFSTKFSSAIIEIAPVKTLIKKKWHSYSKLYTIWMVIQAAFMICLTAYAVERSSWHRVVSDLSIEEYFSNNTHKYYIIVFQWISLLFGFLYLWIAGVLVSSIVRHPNPRRYWKHNLEYIILLLVFAVALIVDVFVTVGLDRHNSVPLVIALFTGWWFNVFFLRGWQLFSFFTVMIKEVIFGDFLRFSVIIAFQLFAFTTSMHTVFQGKDVPTLNDSEYNHYGTTLLTMFNLMLGLSEIEVLHRARVPWLAMVLFVLFVLLTYVLLLNALIAMMSSTCESVLEEKYSVWRIQQLSVILFLENMIYGPFLKVLVKNPTSIEKKEVYDLEKKTSNLYSRFFLDMKSMKRTFASEEDTDTMKKRTQAEVKKTVNRTIKAGFESEIAAKAEDEQSLLESDLYTDEVDDNLTKTSYSRYEEILPKESIDLTKTIHRRVGDDIVIFEDEDRKSTRLNSSHAISRMPSSA